MRTSVLAKIWACLMSNEKPWGQCEGLVAVDHIYLEALDRFDCWPDVWVFGVARRCCARLGGAALAKARVSGVRLRYAVLFSQGTR
jgi:hypothetical protein